MDPIIRYFVEEKHTSEYVANVLTKTLKKYPDIEKEFLYWLENRNFDMEAPLVINGYSARKVHEIAPFLDVAGVYNFMVTLRDDPERAERRIRNGFPIK